MSAAGSEPPARPESPAPGRTVRLRIDLAYDGSGFHGFARQPDQRTVQGVLEDALQRLSGTTVQSTGAGRTDRGVHATRQVVHCDVPADSRPAADPAGARRALDTLCGPQIAVWRVRRVPATFDARFSATCRRYRYRLGDGAALDPLERHRTWHVPGGLDVEAMGAAARHLLGEHDFSSFCRRSGGAHRRRRIDMLAVRRTAAHVVVVAVEGPAFCHQMVRSIVGCLVAVGRGQRHPDWLADVLAARDRAAAAQVAPPHGLVLTGVSYGRRPG